MTSRPAKLTTDPYLAAAETFMVLFFFSWLSNQRRRWQYAFWLTAALAFMIKGPPALLPLAGLALTRRPGQWLAGLMVLLLFLRKQMAAKGAEA